MKKFDAESLYNMMSLFTMIQIERKVDDEIVNSEDIEQNNQMLNLSIIELIHFNLPQSLKYAERMQREFSSGNYKNREFKNSVGILRERIQDELADIIFMFIPKDEAPYFQNERIFGEEVAVKFPQASEDIAEAGNCLAMGRYTACIFHLMRVVEYGLRALAKDLRIKFTRSPSTPVELREWGEIINAIETKIGEIEKRKRTHKREFDLEFYHGAGAQFRHFKNAWRNHVMHTRAHYDESQAKSVMSHVREFMQHLATRLHG